MSLKEFLEKAIFRPSWSEQDEIVSSLLITAVNVLVDASTQGVLKPFTYCASSPEENLFQKVLVAFNYWLKVDPEKLEAISKLNEKINIALTMYVCLKLSRTFCLT